MTEPAWGRRSVLRAGLVALVGGATLGIQRASAVTAPDFADGFAGVRDGPLAGRMSATGHRWRVSGVGPHVAPVILGEAFGPPRGHRPGDNQVADDPNPSASGGYAMVDLAGPVTRVAAEYRWDRSDSTGCGVTIGAFQVRSGGEAAVPSAVSGSRAHLGITPTALYFAVFAVGPLVDFTYLVPLDGTSARVPFPTAQIRDGRTIHRARIEIDGDTARVDVTGLPSPIYYREPRIRSTAASVPFWEYYSVTGATNLPRFTRVSASRR